MKVVNVGVRDSTYVLDGLLHHESDLRIEEHHTDTAGFTDHVFALMHLLGFRFAPRIRDLGDTKLYVSKGKAKYETLKAMIEGTLNLKAIRTHWNEILRLSTSIKQGAATASLMLRKLGSYPVRMDLRSLFANWAAANEHCSYCPGRKASSCAAAFRSASIKAKRAMPWPEQSSPAGSERYGTAASSSNAIVPVALPSSQRPSCSGTRFVSRGRSMPQLAMAKSSMPNC